MLLGSVWCLELAEGWACLGAEPGVVEGEQGLAESDGATCHFGKCNNQNENKVWERWWWVFCGLRSHRIIERSSNSSSLPFGVHPYQAANEYEEELLKLSVVAKVLRNIWETLCFHDSF